MKTLNLRCTRRITCIFLVVGLALVILCLCYRTGIPGNDFWWHIKVGEWICRNKTVPVKDMFSWYGMEHEIAWTAHEWLAEVVFYLIYSATGDLGIWMLSLLLGILMFFLMFWQCRKYIERNVLIAIFYFCIFSVIISMFFFGRPQIFSYFFLFAELKILYAYWEKGRTKWIWFLPFISALWSNFHGGSSNMAYILPLIFIAAEVFPFSIGKIQTEKKAKRWRIQLIVVTFLCAMALLVNPIGIKILTFPYTTLSDSVSMSFISEWAAPDAKDIGQLILFWIPIALMMFGLWAEEKKIQLIDLLVAGFFLFLFLRSQRFIILWFIAAAFSLMKYLPKFEIKEPETKKDKIAVILVEAALCVGFLYSAAEMGYHVRQLSHVISVNLSDEMEAYVINDDPKRIFNDYNFGEDLIRMGVPVFVDARADMYIGTDHLLENAFSLLSLIQVNQEAQTEYVDVEDLFQEYQFDRVLIRKDRALYAYMLGHPEQYEVLYEDDTAVYLAVN